MNQDRIITTKVIETITPYAQEIQTRNQYIQRRDDYIYGDSLMKNATFANGGDKTEYNWLERVVDIHVSQLMGRGFDVFSSYDKRDLSVGSDIQDPKQREQDMIMNKQLKANANGRREMAKAIIKDNGGNELFQLASQSGSAYGFSVIKSWLGDKEKPWHLEVLENIQNFWALWSSGNFRETDGFMYLSQISPMTAQRLYGDYLEEGQIFERSLWGEIPQNPAPNKSLPEEGSRTAITVMEYTGYLHEIRGEDGELYDCAPGEETEINLLIVGGCVVRVETRDDYIPRYYIVPNQRIMRRPWGLADVSDTCIEVNRTYIERMSDWVTLGNKLLYPKWKAMNFDITNVPRPKNRTAEMIPMDSDQDIKLIETPQQGTGFEIPKLLEQLKEDFVRAARISRVLFDDPTAAGSNSNQALMTSMKGTIDAVEKKQQIWEPILTDALEDALRTAAKHFPEIREVADPDDNWQFYIKWPSVLRKEDPVYQQMLLNNFNTGSVSVDTLLEEQGNRDPGEELDRIRDNMSDPVTAAIMGRSLPVLAQQVIAPPPDPNAPKEPDIKHNISWSATMTPEQEANMAIKMGFQDGPFGMSKGPQGAQGRAAQENGDNAGLLNGNPFRGGTVITKDEQGNPLPNPPQQGVDSKNGTAAPAQVQTPAENTEGTGVVSQPGSGATTTSPQGAINQNTQNNGG